MNQDSTSPQDATDGVPGGRLVALTAPLVDVVECDPVQADHLRRMLEAVGVRARLFNGPDAYRMARNTRDAERADLSIVDVVFLGGGTGDEGAGFGASDVPMIAVSDSDDLVSRLTALRSGAKHYLPKPVGADRLTGLLERVIGQRPHEPYRVLMLDDAPVSLEFQAEILRSYGLEVLALSQPLELLKEFDRFDPDVVILDVFMPDAEGPELAAVLRERDPEHTVPILFLSAETRPDRQLQAIGLGGDGFLVKSMSPSHLAAAVTTRAERGRLMKEIRRDLDRVLYERRREHLALDRHAIVSVADRSGDILHVNDRFCEVSGYSRAELIGQNHRVVKSDQHSPEFYADLWRTISGGSIWKGEICNRRKDGEFYWVESTIVPFLDASGKPYRYVSIRTEITQVKKAAEGLRVIQNYANIGTWDWNIRTGELFWSERIAPLFGYPKGTLETTYANFLNSIHTDDRQAVLDAVEACVQRGEKYDIEHRCVWPDGTVRWIAERGDVLRDSEGTPRNMLGVVQDITERKMLQLKLQTSKDIVDSVVSGVVLIDEDGEILLTNPALDGMFGFGAGELVGANITSLMPEPHRSRHPSYLARYKETRQANLIGRTIEITGIRRDGDEFPIEITVSEIEEGSRPLFVGIVRDITDRRRSETELAREQALLRQAQSIARLGNWELDETTSALRWSSMVFEIFGWNPETTTPTLAKFRAAIHPDDLAVVDAAVAESAKTGHYEVVHRIVRPDGQVRFVQERGGVGFDPIGDVKTRRGVVQDITEFKRIEIALHAANDRQRLQLEAALCLRDISRFTLNDELSDEDMLAACAGRLQTGGLSVSEVWARVRHGDRTVALDDARESEYRLVAPIPFFEKIGAKIEVFSKLEASTSSLFTQDDAELLKDVAQQIGQSLIRRADRRALLLAKDEAEAANRAKSDFLSNMSHELRTPLNAIIGFAQVLEIDDTLNEDQLDSVETIRKSGKHLLQLINEILDLARIEAGRLELSLEHVDLAEVLGACETLISPLASARGIEVRFSVDTAASGVRADHTRLKQVLLNLMSNAVKYNRPGGRISISTEPLPTGRIRIAVTDTGHGIPPAKLEELFVPFNRLGAEGSEIEGTGIGLVICKRLTEAMDGRIGVKSIVNKGSAFWIELPASTLSNADATPDQIDPPRFPTATVLYVEDNSANVKLVRMALARHPQVTLLEARDGHLGLDFARTHRPDLILLDINLPGMDGIELMARLRADPATRAIPVVAISAAAMEKDIERARSAGFRKYLTKPIDLADFLDTVEQLLLTPDRRRLGDRRAPPAACDGASIGAVPTEDGAR